MFVLAKLLYNISPFHPLAKYPGPLLWRSCRLFASYHHSNGTLYQQIAAIHEKYGETVRIAPDELSFSDPVAWQQIYNSRPQLPKSRYHFAEVSSEGIPEAIITAPDDEHMRLRRLANPAFLNAGIAEFEPILQGYTDLLCDQLAECSGEGPQNLVTWFLWTLNDVIGQLALDQRFECLSKKRLHPWAVFLMKVLKQVATLTQFVRYGISIDFLSKFTPKDLLEERQMFRDTAWNAVHDRLTLEESEDGKKDKSPDIMSLMLREMKGGDRLTEPELVSNMIVIVGGGAETTSTCLSATFYHLCKTPHAMAALKKEIRGTFKSRQEITLKAVANLPYLKATVDESLRVFPVASYISPRVTPKQGHVIAGSVVPGDVSTNHAKELLPLTLRQTYVSMGQWFMGRSERLFEDAKEFRPERWVEPDARVDDILKPFSMGPRNCLGKL